MNMKTLVSAAIISLGSLMMTGAYAAGAVGTNDATGTDSTQNQIDYNSKHDETQTSNVKKEAPSFKTADTDKNGYVSKAEFEAAKMDKDFKEVDTNTDGQVSEREMNNAVSMH